MGMGVFKFLTKLCFASMNISPKKTLLMSSLAPAVATRTRRSMMHDLIVKSTRGEQLTMSNT